MSDISSAVSDSEGEGRDASQAGLALPSKTILEEVRPGPASAGNSGYQSFEVRIWSIFTFLVCFGMLGVGLYLTPSASGTGTHQQLGLPPCGFYLATGIPCPTCGCTTAVSHFAHGQLFASLITQPFGFAVAVLALIAGSLAVVGAVTGKWIGPSMFILAWYWRLWVFGGVALLVGAWVYKITMVRMGYA